MTESLHVALGVLAGTTGGPASYGVLLARALLAQRTPDRLTVLTDAPQRFQGLRCDVVHLPCRGGLDRVRWQYWALKRALRALQPDVYHDAKNALPPGLAVPAVVTVHDLAYHTVPGSFGFLSRQFLVRATRHAVRRAAAVIVPSLATQRDLARIHPEAAGKVHVVPHGIERAPVVSPERRAEVRARLGLPEHYVLHTGTVQARKNVHLLVQAVRRLRAEGLPHRAVVAGRKGWLAEQALAEFARDDAALWLGAVGDDDLAAITAGAAAFVSPSAYEGFGMAVGDAMAAGVPVVVSNVSSLPEVVGDAGVLLDAISADAIAAALRPLLADADRRRLVGERCRARAAAFAWGRSAAGHRAAYRAAAACALAV
jgi:glycosyltransferase involved in cell wall biosynthesis